MFIETEEDYDKALARIFELMDFKGIDNLKELEHLNMLVKNYESTHYAIDKPSVLDRIKFRFDQSSFMNKIRAIKSLFSC